MLGPFMGPKAVSHVMSKAVAIMTGSLVSHHHEMNMSHATSTSNINRTCGPRDARLPYPALGAHCRGAGRATELVIKISSFMLHYLLESRMDRQERLERACRAGGARRERRGSAGRRFRGRAGAVIRTVVLGSVAGRDSDDVSRTMLASASWLLSRMLCAKLVARPTPTARPVPGAGC